LAKAKHFRNDMFLQTNTLPPNCSAVTQTEIQLLFSMRSYFRSSKGFNFLGRILGLYKVASQTFLSGISMQWKHPGSSTSKKFCTPLLAEKIMAMESQEWDCIGI
jgi:hypothetical protein